MLILEHFMQTIPQMGKMKDKLLCAWCVSMQNNMLSLSFFFNTCSCYQCIKQWQCYSELGQENNLFSKNPKPKQKCNFSRASRRVLTWKTLHLRVSFIATWTCAFGLVVDDVTVGIDSTRSRTQINAFLIDACKVQRTIRINSALRSATHKWISKVTWTASAIIMTISHFTVGIYTTRVRVARVQFNHWNSRNIIDVSYN